MSPQSEAFRRCANSKRWLSLRRATPRPVNYILPYGYGLVFPRCYARLKTWLHVLEGQCPNCGLGASQGLVSLHYAFAGGGKEGCALFLPHRSTTALLALESLSEGDEYPGLQVARETGPASPVIASPVVHPRRRPLAPSEVSTAESLLLGTALEFFAGEIAPDSARTLFLPWKRAKDLLHSG